ERQAEAAEAAARRAARDEARRAEAAAVEARQAEQAEARRVAREASRQAKVARAGERRAAHEEAVQARAARKDASRQARTAKAEERRTARAETREKRAAESKARREQALQTTAARAEARKAARAEARQQRAARSGARKVARAEARQAREARAQERRTTAAAAAQARTAARAETKVKRAADAEAGRQQAQQAKAAKAAAKAAALAAASQAKAARAEAEKLARDQARQAKAVQAEAQAATRREAEQARAAAAEAREAERAAAARVKAAEASARQAESRQAKAAEAEAREAARAEEAKEQAARAEAQKVARREAEQAKAAQAQERQAAKAAQAQEKQATKAEAGRKRAAEAEVRREQDQQAKAAKAAAQAAALAAASQAKAARVEARKAAREQAGQQRASRTDARRAARAEKGREQAAAAEVRREESRQAKAARTEARKVAQAEAARAKATQAEARKAERTAAGQEKAAQAEARRAQRAEAGQAKATQAEARKAERAEGARARAAAAEVRRAESRRAKVAKAEAPAGAERAGDGVGRVARPAVVVLLMAVLGVAAAGWVGGGGADTRAGEVAVVRAAGGSEGGLGVQDPMVGPIEPVYALAAGVWLRATEAGGSLEAVVREARVPSRFLLAGVVGLTCVLFLLLMRVGPGSGAAAGPGPAPPQSGRRWRLGGAALAGALVALDPLLVQSGRAATGTVLAVLLAVGTVVLAWGVPARPTLRWLPLVAAGGGLALLVSPLALPVLAVPVVAELLQGRYQEAWKDMAALGLAIGLWLLLPVWVAGQDLGAGQAGWLLGRPQGRGSVAASMTGAPLTWLLVAAGLAAAILTWRHRSGARSDAGPGSARLLALAATSAAGALGAIALGYPAEQALPFAVPAAAVSLAVAVGTLVAAGATRQARRVALAGAGVVLVGLLVAQVVDWGGRYGGQADDGLGRLVATVVADVPDCSAVNASGPDDRARLLAAGVTVTDFSNGPAAQAAGVRYFVLTGGTAQGPLNPSLAGWIRQNGTRLAAHPSRSLSGVELWRVDADPLDPSADLLPLPDGVFSNTTGSACGGYRVVDSQSGSFHTAYRSVGGKAVLGRPLGSVWTSDGPALQAFDTMVLGAVPTASGPPAVRPIELPPLLAKLDVEAVADADIPLPSGDPPVTNRQARALLRDELIGRAYLGTDPATASAEAFRRARERFGRPLGLPQMMPDGALRQPFERVVLEVPADGGAVRPAALGRLAVRLGLVPRQAMRLEPVPGLPARPAETQLDPAPLLRLVGGALVLLLLAAGAGAVVAWRRRAARAG
ncbi:MAG TPA: hypothetical protein VL330_04000, partial [Actinomycetes bacterium]|nr:hypothetical protein [Actinomycetes bacterium]